MSQNITFFHGNIVGYAGPIGGGTPVEAGTNITFSAGTDGATKINSSGASGTPYNVVTTAATPYSATANTIIRGSAGASADQVINLPAATVVGDWIIVKRLDSNPHNIVLTPDGTDTIDGGGIYNVPSLASVFLIVGASGAWDLN